MADFSELLGMAPSVTNGIPFSSLGSPNALPQFQPAFDEANKALKLTPEEAALYQRHLSNLIGSGGVDHPNGSRSTLYQTSVEQGGKTYNIPTVYDGKILSPDDAVKRAASEGWEKFPSYNNEDEAEARYQQMHQFMDQDTSRYLAARR